MKLIYNMTGINDFIAFDLETTGFSSAYDGITQIGAVRVRNGVVADGEENRFNKLVFQGNGYGKRIPPEVEQLTGITNEMVADADPIETVFREFVEFAGDDILVGYNCFRFDLRFIDAAAERCGIHMGNRSFDACLPASEYIRRTIPGCRKYNLALICDLLGLTNMSAHNAFYDAEVTARVFLRLKDHAGDIGQISRPASSVLSKEKRTPPAHADSLRGSVTEVSERPAKRS